ncbi:MAG: DUF3179 domain-containing protein [Nitrospira sp.]|nr:DUF3179 domain-containing protein [Nitrospira sp.]
MNGPQRNPFPTAISRETVYRRLMSPDRRWTLFLAIGAILILAAWLGLGKTPTTTFDLTRHNVPLHQIVDGGPGKDGIPAILEPRFVSAEEAAFLHDEDRVLGLTLGQAAKAYPIKILNWHEIVNDSLGATPIVVTYCPLCGTGIAFNAVLQGRRHTFGVSGLLYQSDLLMYDHQTESLWSQVGMHAVAGPQTGVTLTPLFLEHTTWSEWRAAHPATLVLSTRSSFFRNYDDDPYLGYGERRDLMFDTTHFDPSYHPKEWVVGVEIDGIAKAYPWSELKKAGAPVGDQVGGRAITIRFNQKSRSASVIDADGTPLPSIMAFWFAWYAFHPNTHVYTYPKGNSP